MHVDGSLVSFQLALNDHTEEFRGGGTYLQAMDCVVSLRMGEVMTFPGQLIHGGVATTDGVRYALVGFGNRKMPQKQTNQAAGDGYYDQPAGVSTGDPFVVVEGTARGPRLQLLGGAASLEHSTAGHHQHGCEPESGDDADTASSCSNAAADLPQQGVALGVSVAWEGCPAAYVHAAAGFALGLHTTDQDVGVLWVRDSGQALRATESCNTTVLGSPR